MSGFYIDLWLTIVEKKMPERSKYQLAGAFFCVVVLLSGFSQAFMVYARTQLELSSEISEYEVDSAFSGQLTHTVQVENLAFSRIIGGMLFVPILRNETNYHYVVIYNITATQGHPKIFNDDSGNTYACWDNLVIEPGTSFSVKIDYYLLSFSFRVRIDPKLTTDYEKNSYLYIEYTQPEELAQSNAPEIISQAASLTKGITNTHEKVSRIYSFVTSHVQYARQEYERGALWALENRTGDCSEFSYLFVALCRAAGIPARIQAGFGFRSTSEKIQDGHMWAEYFLQNGGWIPVDPTWKLFDRMDEKHFYTMRSTPEITPYANYFFNCTQGPDELAIRHTQEILLTPSSMNLFGKELVRNTLESVKTINQARLPVTIEKLLGMPYILQSEAAEVDRVILQGETNLQNAIQLLVENSESAASYALNAQIKGEEASQRAWRLAAYAFAVLIGVLITVLLVTSILVKRFQTKRQRQTLQVENTAKR